jgi:2-polyprenyl-6-methoxyphenol hydroxylase-like FAD-dependent oxidoreductase
MTARTLRAACCIAGGGPAGLMLGYLLSRAGVSVIVLERHADFLRDFRGDTIHPSTLGVMAELGLDHDLLALPHQKVPRIGGQFGNRLYQVADFSRLPVRHPYIAMMPQWDFLSFLAERAKAHPGFTLIMKARAEDLVWEGGRVSGLTATTSDGLLTVTAELVVAADGRHSILRERAGLALKAFGVPMDVLWFRLSRSAGEPGQTMGRFEPGRILVAIDRGDYWQCAIVIPKGKADAVRERGLAAFRSDVAGLLPWAARSLEQDLKSWDDVKLLSVRVDRLETWWRPGFIAIGDAAHAMSPIGGVGINLAIQDAVAAANILSQPLREGRLQPSDLAAVQRRREWPTRATQRMQVFLQNRVIGPALKSDQPVKPPLLVRLADRWSFLRGLTGRLIGLGLRPEHVHSPALPLAR